jgi:hypothetical protein
VADEAVLKKVLKEKVSNKFLLFTVDKIYPANSSL